MPKVQVATTEEVEAYLEANLPEWAAAAVATMISNMMESCSVAGETTEPEARPSRRPVRAPVDEDLEQEAPRRRPRASVDEEEATPRRPGRPSRAPVDEEEATPRRRPSATDDDGDPENDLLNEDTDMISPEEEATPRRPGRPSRAPVDEEEATPRRPAGRPKTVNPTFKALGLDAATVKGYIKDYADGYNSKEIKNEMADNHRVTLKGTDIPTLAKQAAHIYEADTQLQAMSLEELEEQAAAFNLEPDLSGKRGEKAKKLAIIDEIILACLENLA